MVDERISAVAAELDQAERVHGVVSAPRNGVDPEWPLFYAWWLTAWSNLPQLLGTTPTRSELASELLLVDREFRSRERDESWTSFYARRLLEHEWSAS